MPSLYRPSTDGLIHRKPICSIHSTVEEVNVLYNQTVISYTQRTITMNSTKVQNPRRKMQVALLAEPKTPPGVERVYIIL